MSKNVIDYCAENLKISKRLAKKYVLNGKVKINNKIAEKHSIVSENDKIEFCINKPSIEYDLKDFIIVKNENFVCFDKPSFMHTERHSPEDELTIEDMVKENFKNFRLISRLDFETDGIITAINKGYQINTIKKNYLAFVNGLFTEKIILKNKIDAKHRRKVKVTGEKSNNVTLIVPLKQFENHSLVKVTVEQAARHQIRAYMSFLGFPIAGDKLYGKGENCRLMLHCAENIINGQRLKSNLTDKFKKNIKTIIT